MIGTIAIVATGLFAATAVVGGLASYAARMATRRELAEAQFFDYAKQFASEVKSKSDERVLQLIERLAVDMRSAWLCTIMISALRDRWRSPKSDPEGSSHELTTALLELSEQQKDLLAGAMVYACIASTYQRPVSGWLMRLLIVVSAEQSLEHPRVIESFDQSSRGRSSHERDCLQTA